MRLIDPFTKNWLSGPPHALKPFYLENLSTWVGWDKFAKLNVPTLVIRGHRDAVFEKPLFEKVAGSIVGAEEEDIGASGHMVMLERRDAVNRAISRFLEGESKKSWRDDSFIAVKPERDELAAERPWLKHYEEGVPYTIGIPRIPLHHLLRSAVRRYPNHTAIYFEGTRISYRRLNHEANRFANALTALGNRQRCARGFVSAEYPASGDRVLRRYQSGCSGGLHAAHDRCRGINAPGETCRCACAGHIEFMVRLWRDKSNKTAACPCWC